MIVTVIVVQAVFVFNDFTNAAVLPARRRERHRAADLYNFQRQSVSSYNLLFTDVLLITIPPLIMYILFQRQIVAGMTSGAVKG